MATPTNEFSDDELLDLAIKELQGFIKDETTHYAFIEDPRNEEDYDTYEYGTEPIPFDDTWTHESDESLDVPSFVENPDYYEFAENSLAPDDEER